MAATARRGEERAEGGTIRREGGKELGEKRRNGGGRARLNGWR